MLRHDLLSLRLFARACELRSLSRAAEETGIATSAASRRLAQLEHEAQTPLLRRRPHGVEPTPAGLVMLRYAEDVIEHGLRLEATLAEYRDGARGHVRVLASSSILVQRLATDLAAFARANPSIKIDLEERASVSTIEGLLARQAEIGIVVHGFEAPELETFPYGSDRLCLAVPRGHGLARRKRVGLEEIATQDIVSLDNGAAVYRLVQGVARERGHLLRIRVQVRSFEVMCQIIAQGLGIGILPEGAARPLADGLGLKLVTIGEDWAQRQFRICVRARANLSAPAQRLLADLIRSGAT